MVTTYQCNSVFCTEIFNKYGAVVKSKTDLYREVALITNARFYNLCKEGVIE